MIKKSPANADVPKNRIEARFTVWGLSILDVFLTALTASSFFANKADQRKAQEATAAPISTTIPRGQTSRYATWLSSVPSA